MKIKRIARILIALLLILSNIGCDQITKKEVRENINSNEQINVVSDHFILTKVENTGAALGFGANFHPTLKIAIFQLIPCIVMLGMFLYLIKEEHVTKANFVAVTFIIGGGIGNIIDRILYNSVTDFMYLELGIFHTGVFNMGDLSVTIGAIILIFSSIIKSSANQKRIAL